MRLKKFLTEDLQSLDTTKDWYIPDIDHKDAPIVFHVTDARSFNDFVTVFKPIWNQVNNYYLLGQTFDQFIKTRGQALLSVFVNRPAKFTVMPITLTQLASKIKAEHNK